MKKAKILIHNQLAGYLSKTDDEQNFLFSYIDNYKGEPISLTMPADKKEYKFSQFPPFFDGLLPEGIMLEGLLRQKKIDKNDYFSQLIAVGSDLVGAITIEEDDDEDMSDNLQ